MSDPRENRTQPNSTALLLHLRYLRTVLRHKWFVFVAGRRTGVTLRRLLVHDLSKFSRAEWGPYARRFAGGRGGAMDHNADLDEWKRAWDHHWQRNSHHWEFWIDNYDEPQEMSEMDAREMVADWMGAGRAYTGTWDAREWYAKNRDRIVLHPETRWFVEDLLARSV